MQANAGELAEARRLVNRAREALTATTVPDAIVTLHTKLAFAFLALDDREGAEKSVNAALQHVSELEEIGILAAITVAALQAKLGHLEDGLVMLRSVMGERPEDVSFGRIHLTLVLAEQGYLADARAVLSNALRDMPTDPPISALDLAGLYVEAAKVLVTTSQAK